MIKAKRSGQGLALATSFSVSEYSLSLSTATMLASISDDIRTSQFK